MHFETTAVHAGMHVDEETGAVAAPIHLSTTFQRSEDRDRPAFYRAIQSVRKNGMDLTE